MNAKGKDWINFVLGVYANSNICNWPGNFGCLKLAFFLAFVLEKIFDIV